MISSSIARMIAMPVALSALATHARAVELSVADLKARGFGDGPVQVQLAGDFTEMWRNESMLATLKCRRVSDDKRDCVDVSRPGVEELMK